MEPRLRDVPLMGIVWATGLAEALRHFGRRQLRRLTRDQSGQTPTEYLMIVGLMAAAIVTIFITFFWGTVRDAAAQWATKVKEAVMGTGMQ